MFIKMKDETYIPMIESGESNIWEWNNKRRARDWSSCRWNFESEEQKKSYSLTEKEILDAAQRDIDMHVERYAGQKEPFSEHVYTKEEILKNLGWFNCIRITGRSETTAGQFLGFFKSGIRNAVTLEELRKAGCSFRLSWWKGEEHFSECAFSEEELSQKWQECLDKGFTPYIGLSPSGAEYLWRDMKLRTRREKPAPKKHDEYHIVTFDYYGSRKYVTQLTTRKLRFNEFPSYAHKYVTKKAAENAAGRISRSYANITNVRTERVSA